MHLICCHQGRCCWHHLCLHSWDDGTKDNSHTACHSARTDRDTPPHVERACGHTARRTLRSLGTLRKKTPSHARPEKERFPDKNTRPNLFSLLVSFSPPRTFFGPRRGTGPFGPFSRAQNRASPERHADGRAPQKGTRQCSGVRRFLGEKRPRNVESPAFSAKRTVEPDVSGPCSGKRIYSPKWGQRCPFHLFCVSPARRAPGHRTPRLDTRTACRRNAVCPNALPLGFRTPRVQACALF
jgi:hypothetical protein